jgi:putative transposase
MARPLRELVEGALYHVYARGNDKREIFLRDEDRYRYLQLLGEVVKRKRWLCLQYCLMDNHVHLLLETPEANLDSGMQLLHGKYGRWFNDEHRRSGHLFQGRYGAKRITSDSHLWASVGYIAANPVAARLVGRCEDWRWSSHAATVGGGGPAWLEVDRLLEHITAFSDDPLECYDRMVTQAVGFAIAA